MVKGLAILLRWIDPSLQHFENEDVTLIYETCVGYFAFEIGKAFSDERGLTDADGTLVNPKAVNFWVFGQRKRLHCKFF